MKSESISGYSHPAYAKSLSEFGIPRELPNSQAWILQRPIPASPYADAMGCYPLFSCPDWSRLRDDLNDLSSDLVSLAVVTDPFGKYDLDYLKDCFQDVVIPFKEHFVINLKRDPESFVSAHHLRNAKKGLAKLRLEQCADPRERIDDWVGLYDDLIARHQITGMAAFSRGSFLKQLGVPGIVMFRAEYENRTVGMLWWFTQGRIAYYHLAAYNNTGYDLRASFALFKYSIDYFAGRGFSWLSLGGGAGAQSIESGLTRFKAGWATDTRSAYLCGRICDHQKYADLVAATPIETNYFPAYRYGEFR